MNDIVYVGKHAVTHTVSRHAHNTWELIYCTGGGGTITFDDSSIDYAAGDLVVIPPFTPHYNHSETGFTNIHINMQEPTFYVKGPVVFRDSTNHFMLDAFTAAFYHFSDNSDLRSMFLSNYGNLIACYMTEYHQYTRHSRVVDEIENYIIHNYPDCDFDLEAYLRSFHFSYDYLKRIFKKEVGVTPHKYLMDKRLQTAADRLSTSYKGENVAEVARLCGFREPLYFSRMFKKRYGVAPSYYQEKLSREDNRRPDGKSVKIMLEDA